MEPEINEDEVSSDSQSTSSRRPSISSTSSDMPKVNLSSRRDSSKKRQSFNIDINPLNKQLIDEKPIKVLVFNGKCSKIFKSTLKDCVEDCILEFPEENNSIYVPKSIQIPAETNRNSIISLKEQNITAHHRQRSSTNQNNSLPLIGGARNSLSLSSTALAATTAARLRHQLVQKKISLVEDISEESTEQLSIIEPGVQSKRSSLLPNEFISRNSKADISSISLPTFPYCSIPSSKTPLSYDDRQKDYRLSDLVMFGPEHFAHVFNLPRHQKIQRIEKSTELDRIKQDLFHRYLWTKKPEVSCRIRPISNYTRRSAFVT